MAQTIGIGKVKAHGFTLIELLLVLLIVALLAGVVAPVVTRSIDRARESTLKENLYALRKALDDHYADVGDYPLSLEELVQKRYLRHVPLDPMTSQRDTWLLLTAEGKKVSQGAAIADVHSGSDGEAKDGSLYKDW